MIIQIRKAKRDFIVLSLLKSANGSSLFPSLMQLGRTGSLGCLARLLAKFASMSLQPHLCLSARLKYKRPPAALGTKGWRKHKLLGSLEVWIYLFWILSRENAAVLGYDSLVIWWFDEIFQQKCRWQSKRMAMWQPKMGDLKIVLIVYRNHRNHQNIG